MNLEKQKAYEIQHPTGNVAGSRTNYNISGSIAMLKEGSMPKLLSWARTNDETLEIGYSLVTEGVVLMPM